MIKIFASNYSKYSKIKLNFCQFLVCISGKLNRRNYSYFTKQITKNFDSNLKILIPDN